MGAMAPGVAYLARQGIRLGQHAVHRLLTRQGRGVTAVNVAQAYRYGSVYYDPATRHYIRYDNRTGTVVVVNKPSDGKVVTVFEGNRSARWQPVKYRPGQSNCCPE